MPAVQILVAEDDRDIGDLVAHDLQKAGWQVHIAGGGDDALAYARKHSVDLLVLDLMLPGLSGFEGAGLCAPTGVYHHAPWRATSLDEWSVVDTSSRLYRLGRPAIAVAGPV